MGSGKTSWAFQNLFNKHLDENILYISPFLCEIEGENGRIPQAIKDGKITGRQILTPKNKGTGKLGNIANLINNQMDIASTHALFRMFDEDCKQALRDNDYTLILDETLDCVEPYFFKAKDDAEELLAKHDIEIDSNGLVKWTGSERETRYKDVRLLAQNKALFRVDDRFFVWHYPVDIFTLFKKVYILTYMFDGSLMKYYFDMYNVHYTIKSISGDRGNYKLVDYYIPDINSIKDRLNIYRGNYNTNIPQKENVLAYLKKLKHYQDNRKSLPDYNHQWDGYICLRPNGDMIPLEYMSRKIPELTVKAGLPRLKLHELRHTNISLLYEQGASWKELQEWSGDSTARLLMDTYTHVTNKSKAKLANMVDGFLTA